MEVEMIKELITQMTLEEKASLCSGRGPWSTKEIERLGIPRMTVSDGPHGLRKQDEGADNLGIRQSIKAVCFPSTCLLASSFDPEILRNVGKAIGNECQAEDISIILGPGVNIKRSPLCGRNFEYYSEDPHVTSELAAAYIEGVQSQGVGTCIKHFFANNQETRRFSSSSELDDRTAREIYLAAFEGAIKKAKPWTVMCSYNKINGTYSAENKKYLTEILRNEWNFDGFVMSDWGATNARVEDLEAGMELEMPPMNNGNDAKIVQAVKDGKIKEEILNQAVERILNIAFLAQDRKDQKAVVDWMKDHMVAKEAALESIVLLKNEDILPLEKAENILVIGEFAVNPRYQGGGSSHINSIHVESAWECMSQDEDILENITFIQGFSCKNDEIMRNSAILAAKKADKVIIFAGLPESYESEGYDRQHMRLPDNQTALIMELAKVNPDIIVVLHNGAPVEMPWIHLVKAVVETYLGGQAIGSAVKEILYGEANPSGRLAETFPLRLQDTPSYLDYFGEGDRVYYKEGVFVGYRYYDSRESAVLYPFGHGLSYTKYVYDNLHTDRNEFHEDETITLSLDVTNIEDMAGKEVVQLYVKPPKSQMVIRPIHELKGFKKVALQPGEKKRVTFELRKRDFSYFSIERNEWFMESGVYTIEFGKSSRDIVLSTEINVIGKKCSIVDVNESVPMGDILKIPGAVEVLESFGISCEKETSDIVNENEEQILAAHYQFLPLRGRVMHLNDQEINKIISKLRELL